MKMKIERISDLNKFAIPAAISGAMNAIRRYSVRKNAPLYLSSEEKSWFKKEISHTDITKVIKKANEMSTSQLLGEIKFAKFPMGINILEEIVREQDIEYIDDVILWMSAYNGARYYKCSSLATLMSEWPTAIFRNACYIILLNRLCYQNGIPVAKTERPLLAHNLELIRFVDLEETDKVQYQPFKI